MSNFEIRESSDGHEFWRVETESGWIDGKPSMESSSPFPSQYAAVLHARERVARGSRVQVIHYVSSSQIGGVVSGEQ